LAEAPANSDSMDSIWNNLGKVKTSKLRKLAIEARKLAKTR